MSLREQFTEQLKASMKAGDSARTSTLRMILAQVKDADIAARPKGVTTVPDDEIMAMLRGMVKSRRESVELYRQGKRPELAAKEEAEIAVIEGFLPRADGRRGDRARRSRTAMAETGAAGIKDMGQVMAALQAKHAASLDMAKAGPLVEAAAGRLMALPAGISRRAARPHAAADADRPARCGWRARAGNWKGCCPFHGEKTPSLLRL